MPFDVKGIFSVDIISVYSAATGSAGTGIGLRLT